MVRYGNDEFIGIVGNADGTVFNMYCWDLLKNEQDKLNFLKLGEEWWFESNHSIPINILLLNRWKFQPILRSLNNKNVDLLFDKTWFNKKEYFIKKILKMILPKKVIKFLIYIKSKIKK